MKTSLILLTMLAIVVLTTAPATVNPSMLPNHPGYPNIAVEPVKSQSLRNDDPGQSNTIGE